MNLSCYTKKALPELPLHEFVGNVDLRWERMNGLVDKILGGYKNPKVLDLALGGGHDSLYLLERGYRVVSNEIDKFSIEIAKKATKQKRVRLEIRTSRWEKIHTSREYKPDEFDFIFSLGNSFPNYLLKKSVREKALKNFWNILKPGGTLLFDTRNFDYIIENADIILKNPEQNFKYFYKTTYLNRDIKAFPTKIASDKIHFVWKKTRTGFGADLDLWPATTKNVKNLIKRTLGNIELEMYFDYQKKRLHHYDFVQYVLIK